MKIFNSFIMAALLTVGSMASAWAVKGDENKAAKGWELVEEGALLIDVRSASEFETGHIKGALNIPHDQVDELAAAIGDDRNRPVVMYCGSGRRVGFAIQSLEALGYENLFNASGYEAMVEKKPE